jgi:predicted transposase/invertase (TIGR01784 family)
MPRRPEVDPAYIWEIQYHPSDHVYANLMAKVGRFLDRGDPNQDFVGVVIYPNRGLEQKNLHPYRWWIRSDQLVRIYLDDLPAAGPEQFELGTLELIAAHPEAALAKAQAMVPRLRASNRPRAFQETVIQFIETIILYQFPKWSRKEIEKMLQVTDVRETRVFQEALEEGMEKGREEAMEAIVSRLFERNQTVTEIAELTGLTPAQIRKLKKKAK